MSRDFDIVYPPKGKLTFDGGLSTKYERSIIPDNESPNCYTYRKGGTTRLN